MNVFQGKSVLPGIAIGKIRVLKKESEPVKRRISDSQQEVALFQQACKTAKAQLESLYRETVREMGEEQAMIFEVHSMMLQDADYLEAIEEKISSEGVNAEYAVWETGKQFAAVFSSMEDEYFKARSLDVVDISKRIIRILTGEKEADPIMEEPVILVAEDLTPSETVRMDKSKLLALVTRYGSRNSHTAILARSRNLPSLVDTRMNPEEIEDGSLGIVDGFDGTFIVDPEPDLLTRKQNCLSQWKQEQGLLNGLIGMKNQTRDGRSIQVYANIGNPKDVEAVLANDGGGIGLFRSEFLYLESRDYPAEEEQFEAYKEVLERMEGKPVIIRTLDIGADKRVSYFGLEEEENPAMGFRAIRICLEREEIFRTQLRAIYRAAAYGDCAVMFPMITSEGEIKRVKQITEEVKRDLRQENIPFGNPQLGIMIETPAAVMISDCLAKEVDFFSIGTNDLTQYTLAVDRQNERLEDYYDPCHPAILRMIEMTAKNGHDNGIWVGICGELAGELSLTEFFLNLGIDELSVAPVRVLPLRKRIREL